MGAMKCNHCSERESDGAQSEGKERAHFRAVTGGNFLLTLITTTWSDCRVRLDPDAVIALCAANTLSLSYDVELELAPCRLWIPEPWLLTKCPLALTPITHHMFTHICIP